MTDLKTTDPINTDYKGSDLIKTDAYELYQGDCLNLMHKLPSHSIDMVLCDLPYGCTRNKWDRKLPFDALWDQYKRVIKSGGVIALFSKQHFTIETAASNLKQFRYKLVWFKDRGTDFLNANRKPLSSHEDICIFYDKQPLYNAQRRLGFQPYSAKDPGSTSTNWGTFGLKGKLKTQGDHTRYPLDTVTFKHDKANGHSTAKPVALMEWLIKTYTNPNMTILDNCMGGGAVGIAALNTGRRFVGMELNPTFYDAAVKRISTAYRARQSLLDSSLLLE